MLHRILYISTSKGALSEQTLADILRVSRANNATAGLTGLLLVGGKRCLQALEGPPDAVAATFERIRKDDRHFAIVKLDDRQVEARSFGQWAMGYQAGGDVNNARTLSEQVAAIIEPLGDPNLRAYFSGFAARHAA